MAFADVGGAQLFYESTGEGEPVVLVHGGFLDHNLWILNVGPLAERFRVLAIDQPGHGQSTATFDPTATAPELMDEAVACLAGFVEALDLAPAHFVGQSSGGGMILQLAARRPDLFRSMSLHEPTIVALLDDEFAPVRQQQIDASELLSSGDIEAGLATFVGSVGGDWSQLPEAIKDIFRHNAHVYAGAAFFKDPAASLPVPDGLDAFPHPVQFTKGELSPRFFHVGIDRVAAMMQHAEIATIEAGKHAAMLERPAEYTALLMGFLERTQVTRASVD